MRQLFLLFLVLFFILSCMPQYVALKNEDVKIENKSAKDIKNKPNKKNTLAVIAGTDTKRNMYFVKHLELSFLKLTYLELVKQWKIKKQINDYPYKIRGPYKDSFIMINEIYDNTDKEQIKLIFNKLNVRYIAIVWVPVTLKIKEDKGFFDIGENNNLETLHYIMQVFERTSLNDIGKSSFSYFFDIDKDKKTPVVCDSLVKNIGKQLGILRRKNR